MREEGRRKGGGGVSLDVWGPTEGFGTQYLIV